MLHVSLPFKSVSGFTLRYSVLQYGRTFVSPHLTKTFVTLVHYLFRKVERAGNLRPVLICKILAFEYW